MPLEVGYLRAREEDVLSSTSSRLLFLDLEFHDIGRMLDNFGDVGDVTRADFTQDTLKDPDDTANKPVALETMFSSVDHSLHLSELTQKTPIVLKEQKGGLSG